MKRYRFKNIEDEDPKMETFRTNRWYGSKRLKSRKTRLIDYLLYASCKYTFDEVVTKLRSEGVRNLIFFLREMSWIKDYHYTKEEDLPVHHKAHRRYKYISPVTTPVLCKEVIVEKTQMHRLYVNKLVYGEDAKQAYIEANMAYIQRQEDKHLAEQDWSDECIFIINEKYNQMRRDLHKKKFLKYVEEPVFVEFLDVTIELVRLDNKRRFWSVYGSGEHAVIASKVDPKEFDERLAQCLKLKRELIVAKEKEIRRHNEELEKKVIKLERERNLIKLQSHGFDEFSFKTKQRKHNVKT